MHPAFSVIFLTTLIGAGQGMFLAIYTEHVYATFNVVSYDVSSMFPAMASFVGGLVTENGTITEVGLWEKEERRHTPALIKVYRQLTGKKIIPNFPAVKNYRPSDHPYIDLYRHGIHRIATEYAAVCLYLWLMAHSTGELQQVFQEIVLDEINHLTKFWGFGVWLYYHHTFKQREFHSNSVSKKRKLTSYFRDSLTHFRATLHHMMTVLSWNSWTSIEKIELIYTFLIVWQRMHYWSTNLTSTYLEQILNSSDLN